LLEKIGELMREKGIDIGNPIPYTGIVRQKPDHNQEEKFR
jgi:hypothetical protein